MFVLTSEQLLYQGHLDLFATIIVFYCQLKHCVCLKHFEVKLKCFVVLKTCLTYSPYRLHLCNYSFAICYYFFSGWQKAVFNYISMQLFLICSWKQKNLFLDFHFTYFYSFFFVGAGGKIKVFVVVVILPHLLFQCTTSLLFSMKRVVYKGPDG